MAEPDRQTVAERMIEALEAALKLLKECQAEQGRQTLPEDLLKVADLCGKVADELTYVVDESLAKVLLGRLIPPVGGVN